MAAIGSMSSRTVEPATAQDQKPSVTHDEDAATIYSPGSVPEIKLVARELLENYSGIAPEDVDGHVMRIRDRGFQIQHYPCIAHLRFLALSLSKHPKYPQILERLGQGQTFLDIGGCFGQELRKLVYDGTPSENLYCMDRVEEFVNLGYELFLDKNSLKSHFTIADMMDPSLASSCTHIIGKIDIINASSFFHLFEIEDQISLSKKVVGLLRPQKGSLLVGRQLGSVKPGAYPVRKLLEGKPYRHDVATFERMWKQVGEATGSSWLVEATMDEEELGYKGNESWGDPRMRRLRFAVSRL